MSSKCRHNGHSGVLRMESYNNNNNRLAKQLQRPWQSLFGCDSSIWMHKSNIYMRHGFDLGCAAASQRLTTHMWSKQCAWWGRHLNAITQREIAGKLLRSSDGDRDETRNEHVQPCPLGAAPSPSPFAVRQPRRLQRFL